MTVSVAFSGAIMGIEGYIVRVESFVSNGLPSFTIVGLPDVAVKESRERVRAALKQSGFEFPLQRITINLAPADTRKEGARFDLPIALTILAATSQLDPGRLREVVALGELALDGSLRPVSGVLPVAIAAKRDEKSVLVPIGNEDEAACVEGLKVYAFSRLNEVVEWLNGVRDVVSYTSQGADFCEHKLTCDLAEVKGQNGAKRALEVAAAGGHNLLLVGPPGSGKTLLAKCLPSILPPLSLEESFEVTAIYSSAGLLPVGSSLIRQRPFRSPTHSLSRAALLGGGMYPQPGEVTLAHRGILYLDEITEYDPAVLEMLRAPVEDGQVLVSRLTGAVKYPCMFMLVASMNPWRFV